MSRVGKIISSTESQEVTFVDAERVGRSSLGDLLNLKVLRIVLDTQGSRMLLVILAAAISFLYTILLPFDFTQRLSFANWHYLTPYLFGWSVFIGLGMALVIVLQVHAMRVIGSSKSWTLGGFAFIGSILSSFLCCTPIIPTLLAFIGMSAVSVYGTTGALQHFFATNQTELLSGSAVLLAISVCWALRSIARADCLSEAGCINDGCSTIEVQNHSINMTSTMTKESIGE